MSRLLNVQDLCFRLKLCKATFYKLLALGQLPPYIQVGGRKRWTEQDVADWLAAQSRESAESGCYGCGDPHAPLDSNYCPACCGTAWTTTRELVAHA